MKKITIYIFLFFAISLNAQTVTVSETMTLRNDAAYHLLGNLKGNILLLRDRVTEFEVECYNQDLKKTWEKEIELDKRKPEMVGILPTQNHFTILYTHRIKGDIRLKAHKYDPAANLVDSLTVKDYGNVFYTPNIDIIRSEDKTKILAYYHEN